jgi:hypothetical protein
LSKQAKLSKLIHDHGYSIPGGGDRANVPEGNVKNTIKNSLLINER